MNPTTPTPAAREAAEPKPCPLCGGPAKATSSIMAQVGCDECRLHLTGYQTNLHFLIVKWNQRVLLSDREAEIESQQEEITRLKAENSTMRLESKYLIELNDGFPPILDFVQIEKDLEERDALRQQLASTSAELVQAREELTALKQQKP